MRRPKKFGTVFLLVLTGLSFFDYECPAHGPLPPPPLPLWYFELFENLEGKVIGIDHLLPNHSRSWGKLAWSCKYYWRAKFLWPSHNI